METRLSSVVDSFLGRKKAEAPPPPVKRPEDELETMICELRMKVNDQTLELEHYTGRLQNNAATDRKLAELQKTVKQQNVKLKRYHDLLADREVVEDALAGKEEEIRALTLQLGDQDKKTADQPDLETRNEALKEKNAEHQKELGKRAALLNALKTEKAALVTSMKLRDRQKTELEDKVAALRKELEETDITAGRFNELDKELAHYRRLASDGREAEKVRAHLEEQVAEQEFFISSVEAEMRLQEDLQETCAQLQRKLSDQESQVEYWRQEADRRKKLESGGDILDARIETLEKERAALVETTEKLHRRMLEVDRVSEEKETLREVQTNLSRKIEELEEEKAGLLCKIEEFESDQTRMAEIAHQLEAKANSADVAVAEREHLEKTMRRQESRITQYQKEIAQSRRMNPALEGRLLLAKRCAKLSKNLEEAEFDRSCLRRVSTEKITLEVESDRLRRRVQKLELEIERYRRVTPGGYEKAVEAEDALQIDEAISDYRQDLALYRIEKRRKKERQPVSDVMARYRRT